MKRFLLSLVAFAAVAAAAADKPNILFILSDDVGLDGVGCYGSDRFKGRTPNLDRLAATGLRFTQCYANPFCGPSRCTINTGRYVFRTGGHTNQTAGNPSPQKEIGLAKVIKQAGYATGFCGKWRQMGAAPSDWGFDEYITDPTAGGWYWKNSYTKNGQQVQTPKEIYYEDVIRDFAVDFFRRHKDGPFFFYYSTHLVHGPILRTPDSKPDTKDFYEDNVAYLDKQVGALVAALDQLGLREKTLIVFTGDNGTARFGADRSTLNGRRINGMKGTLLEGGSRVPLIANRPGAVPAGKVLNDLVDFSDFFTTFADVAGAKLPEGVKLDGHSFAPQLRGEKGTPRDWIFVQLGAGWYVRDQGFKLTQSGELFDMSDAPFIEKPVVNDAAKARLQAVLDQLNPAGGVATKGPGKGEKKRKK
jgi:arylsulfatase A